LRIPNNYLAAIAHGKNGEISPDDGIITVPPVIIPAFDIPRPMPVNSDSTGKVINDSCATNIYTSRTNQVAADVVGFYLLSGLWRVQAQIIIWWNFAVPDGSFVANLDAMDQAGTRCNQVSAYSAAARGIYTENFDRTYHIKPRPDLSVVQGDVWTFFMQIAATNAVGTNSIQMQAGLTFSRYI
jgi:Tfp pilus assembly protein PilW